MTVEQLAADYAHLARESADLARKYADLYAASSNREKSLEKEIDLLSAEIAILHAAVEDLKSTVKELREQMRGDAEKSGSFAAQEVLNRRELASLQEADKERRRTRAKFWGGVALIFAGIFAGGATTLVWHLVTAEAKSTEARPR